MDMEKFGEYIVLALKELAQFKEDDWYDLSLYAQKKGDYVLLHAVKLGRVPKAFSKFLGNAGSRARNEALSPVQKKAISKKANAARWEKAKLRRVK